MKTTQRKPTRAKGVSARKGKKRCAAVPIVPVENDGLQPAQRKFCLAYLANGFNGTQAYIESHPGVTQAAAGVNASKTLRLARIRAFLNIRLEDAWKPHQMGGEQALGRVARLASDAPDDRVRLQALRVILEQTGKLKTVPDSIDALAAALRADLEKHGDVAKSPAKMTPRHRMERPR